MNSNAHLVRSSLVKEEIGDMLEHIYQQLQKSEEASFEGKHEGHEYRVKFSFSKARNSKEEITEGLKRIIGEILCAIESRSETERKEMVVPNKNRSGNINGCDPQTSLDYECNIR